jgi:4-hydroxy-2-oxoheptanedioate aldolase
VIPQVETVEQAKHVVSAAKYGTKQNGTRSAPPFRLFPGLTDAPYDGVRDIHKCLNDQAAIMIQIETLEGIRNLDAILAAVPDIDTVWLGSLDCRISMNLAANFGGPQEEPEWVEAVALFKATLKKHDKPWSGMSLFGLEGVKRDAQEMSLIFITADILHLMQMNQTLLDARHMLQAGSAQQSHSVDNKVQ